MDMSRRVGPAGRATGFQVSERKVFFDYWRGYARLLPTTGVKQAEAELSLGGDVYRTQ